MKFKVILLSIISIFIVSCADIEEDNTPKKPPIHYEEGFGDISLVRPNFHCGTSCQLPVGSWKNTPNKECIICHSERPILDSGTKHQML